MIKYRIKEEVKKYLNPDYEYYDSVMTNQEWYHLEWTHEALEEVEEKIEVIRIDNNKRLQRSGNHWTEQERKDIEKFLNVFGSWEILYEYLDNTTMKIINKILEEKGYDK